MNTEKFCNCDCHKKYGIKHIKVCCQGQCEGCGKFISLFNYKHKQYCYSWYLWASKQKRKYLKQIQLYETYQLSKKYFKTIDIKQLSNQELLGF